MEERKMNSVGAAKQQSVAETLQRGMESQLQRWRREVLAPGLRLGWKIGFNDRPSQQRLSLAEPVIGFLRRDRLLSSGGRFAVPAGVIIKAEVEIALCMGRDLAAGATVDEAEAAIAALAPAVEVVNVTQPLDGIEAILAGNLYHAAVLIGPERPGLPANPRAAIRGNLRVNDKLVRESEAFRLPERFGDLARVAAETLARHGERLCAGDWIICGSIVDPYVVEAGDHIKVEISSFEPVTLAFSS
jgi:2-keto-4-pentenoate hydratase